MLKWFNKNKLKFFSCFALCFCLSLFGFMAFSSKVYAWSIDDNGNLESSNLFDIDSYYTDQYNDRQYITIIDTNGTYTLSSNTTFQRIVASIRDTNSLGTSITDIFDENNIGSKTFTVSGLSSGQVVCLFFRKNNSGHVDLSSYSIMLNSGSSPLSYEPYGYWYSSSNYGDLYQDYVNLSQSYSQLNNVLYNGWLGYCSFIRVIDNTSNTSRSFSFDDLVDNNVISNGYFNYLTCVTLLSSYDYNHSYTITFTPRLYDPIETIYLNYRSFFIQFMENSFTGNSLLQIYDSNNFVRNFSDLNGVTIDGEVLFDNMQHTQFNGLINTVSLTFIASDVGTSRFTTNSDFANGYLAGQTANTQQFQDVIDRQNGIIEADQRIIEDKNASIAELQSLYNDLQDRYSDELSGNNFISLFFTIAETPFASFKQIWNVDFLGVNLAGFVTGILFIGLIIWVVKKIF